MQRKQLLTDANGEFLSAVIKKSSHKGHSRMSDVKGSQEFSEYTLNV